MFTNSNKVLPLATPLIRHGNLAVFVFFVSFLLLLFFVVGLFRVIATVFAVMDIIFFSKNFLS